MHVSQVIGCARRFNSEISITGDADMLNDVGCLATTSTPPREKGVWRHSDVIVHVTRLSPVIDRQLLFADVNNARSNGRTSPAVDPLDRSSPAA